MIHPWTIPVPVEESTFVPLREEHRDFNVEVSLGRLGTYSGRTRSIPADRLLHCDFQLDLHHNHAGRLGAGRAGFHRDHYLKGIGRTLLAGNWNTSDLYHNSGILLTSGAIREYLISGLLAAHGHAELVNPCTGILVRPLPGDLQDHVREVFTHGEDQTASSLPPVDGATQAISVKAAGFARMSNIVWWVNQLPLLRAEGDDRIAELFEALGAASTGFESDVTEGIAPDVVARHLAARFELLIERLQAAWSLGIDWGSVHNNYSLDGRFLDLEMPTVFPSAALGFKVEALEARGEKAMLRRPGELIGLVAPLRCALEMKLFAAWLESRLTFMIDHLPMYGLERDCVRCFLEELEQALSEPHPLSAPEHLARAVIDPIAATLHMSSAARRELEGLFSFAVASVFPGARAASRQPPELRLRRLDGRALARTEPDTRWVLYVPEFVRDACTREHPLNLAYNRCASRADELDEPQELLDYLRSVTFEPERYDSARNE
ncbi:hypothetical protein [Paraliomyxa miuraensis]|uniref:hypothetical protein n=1 Tax=Paraliomyxa miuraensis TaxID=376150 RepID=UPI002257490D|nr:hypothetical protein [Paraliomyxa miuraensis]MCX4247772.1 hypothetical protein [Paraliomyxa miuraensis]